VGYSGLLLFQPQYRCLQNVQASRPGDFNRRRPEGQRSGPLVGSMYVPFTRLISVSDPGHRRWYELDW